MTRGTTRRSIRMDDDLWTEFQAASTAAGLNGIRNNPGNDPRMDQHAQAGGEVNKLLCWLGFHEIHYTWKTKQPYCVQSKNCKATK
jgi:hypothetical protein